MSIQHTSEMNPFIRSKLEFVRDRFEELSELLSDPDIINNQNQFRDLSREYSKLEPVVNLFQKHELLSNDIIAVEEMAVDADDEIRKMGQQELAPLNQNRDKILLELQKALISPDPRDNSNIYLEIRAGTGGDEAAIFVGNLFRMYSRYAEAMRWSLEIINMREGEHGGYKEIISRITGNGIYARLKFEFGVHRVQRVPATESQGRIHTSTCTVAVLPEVAKIEEIEINSSDLRVDTYRASGAGGQHVNKTDSAVRLTHLPTGIVVECQDERSQHKNRARAMSLLQAKLLDMKLSQRANEQAKNRKLQVGSGERSERIRTYNYPQGRVTDHRVNLTLYKLSEILEGNLDQIIQPLVSEYEADQLTTLSK